MDKLQILKMSDLRKRMEHEDYSLMVSLILSKEIVMYDYVEYLFLDNINAYLLFKKRIDELEKVNKCFQVKFSVKEEIMLRRLFCIFEYEKKQQKFNAIAKILKKSHPTHYQYAKNSKDLVSIVQFIKTQSIKSKEAKYQITIEELFILTYLAFIFNKDIEYHQSLPDLTGTRYLTILNSVFIEREEQMKSFSKLKMSSEEIESVSKYMYNPNLESKNIFEIREDILNAKMKEFNLENDKDSLYQLDLRAQILECYREALIYIDIQPELYERQMMSAEDLKVIFKLKNFYSEKYSWTSTENIIFITSLFYMYGLSREYKEARSSLINGYKNQTYHTFSEEKKRQEIQLELKRLKAINEEKTSLNKELLFEKRLFKKNMEELRAEIVSLKAENQRLLKENQDKDILLKDKEVDVRDLNLNKSNLYVKKTEPFIAYEMLHYEESDNKSPSVTEDEMINFLKSKKLIIIGGYKKWLLKLKNVLPNIVYFTSDQASTLSFTQKDGYIFFNTSSNAHKLFRKVMKEAQKEGKAIYYLNHSGNIDRTLIDIYQQLINVKE